MMEYANRQINNVRIETLDKMNQIHIKLFFICFKSGKPALIKNNDYIKLMAPSIVLLLPVCKASFLNIGEKNLHNTEK